MNVAAIVSLAALNPQLFPPLKSIRPCTLLNCQSKMLAFSGSLKFCALFLAVLCYIFSLSVYVPGLSGQHPCYPIFVMLVLYLSAWLSGVVWDRLRYIMQNYAQCKKTHCSLPPHNWTLCKIGYVPLFGLCVLSIFGHWSGCSCLIEKPTLKTQTTQLWIWASYCPSFHLSFL